MEKIEFTGHSGATLAARMDRPSGQTRAVAIFAHCFTCGKDIAAARRVSQRLAALGVAVLRFDFTGLGHSDGEFANTGFSGNIKDLLAAAEFLRGQGTPPQMLIGHSLGGAAVLAAAGQIPEVEAVVTIGAPSDPAHVAENFSCSLEEIEAKGQAEVTLAGRSFTIARSFIEDLKDHRLLDAVTEMRKPLLVMHAPLDAIVSIDHAAEIFTAAKHPKSFVTLDDADHLLSRPEDADYAAGIIAAWATRYLSAPAEPEPDAPEAGVRVTEAPGKGYLNVIDAPRGRSILADEPESLGGTDKGLTPFELVEAGLGACTSITLRMYANRKKWPLEGVSVTVTMDQTDRTNTRFQRVIALSGPLTKDQRERLLEIANKCPVHRALEGEIAVETRLDAG